MKKESKNIGKTHNIVESGKGLAEKINRFFRLNNYLITVGLAGMMLLTMCDNRSYKKQIEKELQRNTEFLKNNIQSIGFVDATGMLITVDRKPVDYNDKRIQNAIIGLVSQPFLQGGEQIKGSKMPKSAREMVDNNALFNDLYSNLTQRKDKVSEVLSAIYKTLSNLYYPEFVTVKSRDVVLFSATAAPNDPTVKEFKAVVRYAITTKSWIVQLGKWVDQDIVYTIEFGGVIDPAKYADADNLLGFKITSLKVPILQKPSLGDLAP